MIDINNIHSSKSPKLDSKEYHTILEALGALSTRKILSVLSQGDFSVNEIAQKAKIPQSTAVVGIKKLDRAGLILIKRGPGNRKVCTLGINKIELQFVDSSLAKGVEIYTRRMPVGLFSQFEIIPPCGLVGTEKIIGIIDDVRSFYDPRKITAGLIWFSEGYIEYTFPNPIKGNETLVRFEIMLEMCSEAPHFNNIYPSDITMWVNGKDVGTWTCPGDFGGEKGEHTPLWWQKDHTQYGLLKKWGINDSHSYIDGDIISEVVLENLNLKGNKYITIRWGNKKDAIHKGGINIFGEGFGNYSQDIIMNIEYKNR